VQGPEAVSGVVGGMAALEAQGDVDVMIVARGGGSIEELWAFNDEQLARAIFACGVPVVSAVGHETDYTIADYVADARAPTPSAAAEIVSPDRIETRIKLGIVARTMEEMLRSTLRSADSGLRARIQTLDRRVPSVQTRRQQVDDLVRRGVHAAERGHREKAHGVGNCVWRLKSLDPYATLDRGYAIVQRKGAVVSSVASVKAGDALQVRVKDGSFGVVTGPAGATPRRRARKQITEAQAPLFTMPEERA